MNEGSGAIVAWILVPLFAAVGIYLVWYSRRRKKMLEAFAREHQLIIRPEREEEFQKILDSFFSLEDENLVRSFGQISSLIDAGPVSLFRAVELFDINPHAQSQSTHFPRIVALCNVSPYHDEFFFLDKSMQIRQKLPKAKTPNADVIEIVKRIVTSCNARHPLSVTLTRGHGLIFFEPLVTGGETMSDVNALYCIAKGMCEQISGDI